MVCGVPSFLHDFQTISVIQLCWDMWYMHVLWGHFIIDEVSETKWRWYICMFYLFLLYLEWIILIKCSLFCFKWNPKVYSNLAFQSFDFKHTGILWLLKNSVLQTKIDVDIFILLTEMEKIPHLETLLQ